MDDLQPRTGFVQREGWGVRNWVDVVHPLERSGGLGHAQHLCTDHYDPGADDHSADHDVDSAANDDEADDHHHDHSADDDDSAHDHNFFNDDDFFDDNHNGCTDNDDHRPADRQVHDASGRRRLAIRCAMRRPRASCR
jgi:hypothetical protein